MFRKYEAMRRGWKDGLQSEEVKSNNPYEKNSIEFTTWNTWHTRAKEFMMASKMQEKIEEMKTKMMRDGFI